MSYRIIFSISETMKQKFFDEGVSWAKNITKRFQTITISQSKAQKHKSTEINWMNSRGSPGNWFIYDMFVTFFHKSTQFSAIRGRVFRYIAKVWVAKVRAHTHTRDVRSHVCVCVRNPFWKVCEMCVRAARLRACDVRSHFCTLLEQNGQDMAFFCLKNCFRTSFSVLEYPLLL